MQVTASSPRSQINTILQMSTPQVSGIRYLIKPSTFWETISPCAARQEYVVPSISIAGVVFCTHVLVHPRLGVKQPAASEGPIRCEK
jgi:hypothetical protein